MFYGMWWTDGGGQGGGTGVGGFETVTALMVFGLCFFTCVYYEMYFSACHGGELGLVGVWGGGLW